MFERDNPPGVTIIARVGKRQTLSKKAEKDRVLTTERLRRNESLLGFVGERLRAYSAGLQKKELLLVAQSVDCVSLDRLAKRSRDCLLCWFCENWSMIESRLPGCPCVQQPRVVDDSRNSCVCAESVPETAVEHFDDFDDPLFGFSSFDSPFAFEGGFELYDVLQ
jgi:hypothetical protein